MLCCVAKPNNLLSMLNWTHMLSHFLGFGIFFKVTCTCESHGATMNKKFHLSSVYGAFNEIFYEKKTMFRVQKNLHDVRKSFLTFSPSYKKITVVVESDYIFRGYNVFRWKHNKHSVFLSPPELEKREQRKGNVFPPGIWNLIFYFVFSNFWSDLYKSKQREIGGFSISSFC